MYRTNMPKAKMLMKEIEDLKKWREILYLRIEDSTLKMSILQNFVSDKREAKILLKTNTQYTTLAENAKRKTVGFKGEVNLN